MIKFLRNCRLIIILTAIPFLALNSQHAYAVTTKMWTNTDQADISKGKLQNVSVHSNGKFTLSPDKRRINEIPAEYVWCLVADGTDSLFAGTGNPGTVFKVSHDGNVVEYYKTPDMHVYTLAIDSAGNIFAGTLPHGRIYKITSEGKGEVFCELPDPYVWNLVSDKYGNLYAATGNNGVIYKISNKGIPSVFFDSPSSNILDLVIDDDDIIYAACEPEGFIYKINPNGNASVLYDSDEEEIHCLAINKDGVLYAGTSSGIPPVLHTPAFTEPPEVQLPLLMEEFPGEPGNVWLDYVLSADDDMEVLDQPPKKDVPAENGSREMPVIPEMNSVYRIDKDGRVREIFVVEDSFILCLAVDNNNDVLVGTGNKAKLFKINNKEEVSLLHNFSESQILDILSFKDGIKYMATGNNANIYQLTGGYSNEGIYESIVHDNKYISSWGCISWKGKMPPQTNIKLSTRSGNNKKPDITWSDWSQEYQLNGGRIESPSARFIQYRATLTTDNSETTPALEDVSIAYLPQNQPPIIRHVEVTTPRHFPGNESNNYDAPDTSEPSFFPPDNVYLENSRRNHKTILHGPRKLISWEADDPNNDRLEFDLEYKSVDESKWKELKRSVKERNEFYWNTNRIPDGYYQTKVIACDDMDNPLELALKEEVESDTFLIDNTRPVVLNLRAVIEGDSIDSHGRPCHTIIVSGVAKDEMCNITDIQYSIDSGDWQTAFPEDKIFDSTEETFLLKISYISPDEHTIVINAMDYEGNIGSSRIVFNP